MADVSSYARSVEEVKAWLGSYNNRLSDQADVLIENGYDDLECIAECTDDEIFDIEDLLRTTEAKRAIRYLIAKLREVGYEQYLKGGLPPPSPSFFSIFANESKEDSVRSPGSGNPDQNYLEGISGQLLCQGEFSCSFDVHNWSRKYLVLCDTTLYWFNSPRDRQAVGNADLAGATVQRIGPAATKVLVRGGDVICMEASDAEQLKNWLTHLQAATNHGAADDAIKKQHAKRMTDMLVEGGMFRKYKHGSAKNRLIWCSPTLDRIMWGEDKKNVKGFLSLSELTGIQEGMVKDKFRINLVFPDRLLELESRTESEGREWLAAFNYLLDKKQADEESRRHVHRDSLAEMESDRRNFRNILLRGETLKKHKRGGYSIRTYWCTPTLDRLEWGDIEGEKRKVKGFFMMNEIVQLLTDPNDPCRFTLVAKGKSVELEAMSKANKEAFMRALQFFI